MMKSKQVLFIFLVSVLFLLKVSDASASPQGLLIVTTFPNIADEIKQIACEGDVVISIAPYGVDPHSYQLTPENIELLSKADVIISTAHAPFEISIGEMVRNKELKGALIEIPKLEEIKILINPSTGKPNYHMPIYDPHNYKAFIKRVANTLAMLNPKCYQTYMEKAEKILQEVRDITSNASFTNLVAVADSPPTQYAVAWLGIKVKYLLIKEHGVSATPSDLLKIEEAISKGEVKLAVILSPTSQAVSKKLEALAKKYGIPILYVPAPFSRGTIPEKLKVIIAQLKKIQFQTPSRTQRQVVNTLASANLAFQASLLTFTLYLMLISLKFVRKTRSPLLTKLERLVMSALLVESALLAYFTNTTWFLVMASAAVAYGALSAVIAARRLFFLAGASAHSALLAAVIAIPLTETLGLGSQQLWSIIVGILLTYTVGYMINRGIKSDIATAVFVSATASISVLAIYYVLTNYSLESDIWAIIVGDPLLARWSDALYSTVIALIILMTVVLTFREQVCIGTERDCVALTGLRIKLYDWLFFTLLGLATVALIRTAGFVLEHVLILLPASIALSTSKGSLNVILTSIYVSTVSSLYALYLGVLLNHSPAAIAGIILLTIYLASLAWKVRK